MSKKTTKRALAMSFVSVFLCVCMLVGTTFAWFTDSVTSSGNKIQAGNLDIELLMDANINGTYDDISNSTSPIFGKGSIAQNNNAETLWEPGKTQVAYLAIKNNGNLDLKYTVALNVVDVKDSLYKVMEYAIVPDADATNKVTAWNGGTSVVVGTQSVSDAVELKVGKTHYFALAIHMDEMAGNRYQGGEVNFDLTVLATQVASESDSFDNQYDKNSEFAVKVETADALADAIANGMAVALSQDVRLGKIDLTDTITNDVVIDANGHTITTTDAYGIEVTAGKNVTISNADVKMTKEGDNTTYAAGFKIANGDYAGATITLKDCTITMANTDWAYAVTMPAGVKNLNLVIDNCTLEGAIAVQCWGDKNTITITNSELICNYTTNETYTSHCVALQADSHYVAENNTLVIDNCAFKYSGVDNFDKQIYAVKNYRDSNTVKVTNCIYGDKVVAAE